MASASHLTSLSFAFVVALSCIFGTSASADVVAIHGEGFLERKPNGMTVVHTKGTPYEMGYQYGKLLGPELLAINDAVSKFAEKEISLPAEAADIVKVIGGAVFKQYFEQHELDQLQGILDALDDTYGKGQHRMNLETLVLLNSLVDAGGIFSGIEINCNSFAAWGSLTDNGKMVQTRNIDLFTGYGLEDYAVVEIAKEDGMIPIANLSWTGHIAMATGMNAKGLGLGQVWARSTEKGIGRPWTMNVRDMMGKTWSSEVIALDLKNEPNRTYGSNFIFADPISGEGIAVETTAHQFAMFRSMDPAEVEMECGTGAEAEPCAIQIRDAVFRGDASFDLGIRAVQTSSNGPHGDPRQAGAYKNRYKGQADRIKAFRDAGVPIGAQEAIAISSETAMRGISLQCAVYENSDLQVYVADSYIDDQGVAHDAWSQEYKHYDFDAVAPTMDLKLNGDVFRSTSTLNLDLVAQNYGSAKPMDVYVFLEAGGNYYFLPTFSPVPAPIRVDLAKDEQFSQNLLNIKTLNLPTGDYTFYAAMFNPTTGALANLSVVPFSKVGI